MIRQNIFLSADSVIFFHAHNGAEVLLVRRRSDPYKNMWALPGGFVEDDEPLEKAAQRELEEETGLFIGQLHQIGAFGDPDRDPRGRTVTVAFWGTLALKMEVAGKDDAAEAAWFPISSLPELAFDHKKIIQAALSRTKMDLSES